METTHLGRTGLRVSRIALGTMNLGPHVAEPDAHRLLDHALDRGVFFVDTADIYGWKEGEGWTERIVGRWLAQGGGRRERVVLATKVFGRTGPGPNDRGLSALHVRQACEQSLRRLQTDHIDLYQLHHLDRDTPWEEIWQAMELLVRQGKVLYAGTSNLPAWEIARGLYTARERHLLGPVSEQSLYNLSQRTVELEVLPACRALGLGLLPWSPLGGGALAGSPAEAGGGRRATERVRARIERLRPRLEPWEAFCRELGEPPARVALAWLLHQPGVTAPIVGARDPRQLDGAISALDLHLDAPALEELDRIFPGPGGPAPEAYAW